MSQVFEAYEPQGRQYHNPNGGDFGNFQVLRTAGMTMNGTKFHAQLSQNIIRKTLDLQLGETCTPEQIDALVDPTDPQRLQAQTRLLVASEMTGDAFFVHTKLVDEAPEAPWHAKYVGVAKARFADGRHAAEAKLSPNPAAARNLADFRGLYVLPHLVEGGPHLQGNGIGSAQAHFLLSQFPALMPVIAWDFPEINPRMVETFKSWEFFPNLERDRPHNLAGRKVIQRMFVGPSAGELLGRLERLHPWLADWQPVGKEPARV